MSELNDLRERLDEQHALVLTAQQNAASALLLATLRETQAEHGHHIKALRHTHEEHGQQLAGLRTEMAEVRTEMRAGFTEVKADMSTMKADICRLKGGLDEITTLLRRRPKDA